MFMCTYLPIYAASNDRQGIRETALLPSPLTNHITHQSDQHPNSRLLPDGGYLGVLVASIVTTATAGLGCLASFLFTKCVLLCVCVIRVCVGGLIWNG